MDEQPTYPTPDQCEQLVAAARKIVEDFRKMEARLDQPPHWGYLDEHKQVVRCHMSDMLERTGGCDPFATMDRRVGADYVRGHRVSTVFLGLDHGMLGRPMWFETMVFHQSPSKRQLFGRRMVVHDELHMARYETYEQATEGHQRIVEQLAARVGWARWLGYSRSHLRKIRREQRAARLDALAELTAQAQQLRMGYACPTCA